ncbi:MAG: hypothetical protein WA364_18130 [Candidatus Nitrosopolaris sp.]
MRHLIYEYEQCTDEDYRNDEGKIDERWKIQDALELKLMKNARHKLLTSYSVSKKTLFDPYTISVLIHLCDSYIKTEEDILKDPSSVDYREELGKVVDVLSRIRETIDLLPQIEKPLCYQCAAVKYMDR